jgi:porin
MHNIGGNMRMSGVTPCSGRLANRETLHAAEAHGPGDSTRTWMRAIGLFLMLTSAGTMPAFGQVSGSTSSQPQITQTWPAPTHIFGDWNGLRTKLADLGITYSLTYTSESVYNAVGGLRTGADYAHQIGLAVNVDWEKIAGIQGFTTHTNIINRAGRNASADNIGDTVIQAQEIYGAGFGVGAKLVWFYGEEKLFNDRVNVAFGRLAPGTDFNASPLFCNFMTLTICGHDRALTANQGFEDWPMSVWGGRIRVRPTADTYVMVGVFQSQPFPTTAAPYTQGGHSGWDWTWKGTTGASIPIEVGYEPVIGRDQLPGHYKLGFNWDTTTYADNFFDLNGLPLALTGLPGAPQRGRGQFWATADQMILRNGPNPNDGLILLATFVHDQSDTTLFNNFVWTGLIDRGFWSAHPNDQIAFGFTYYDVSKKLTDTEQLQQVLGNPLAGGAFGVQTYAMVLEANYGIAVAPGLLIQPELEYFIRPGGTNAVRNAFLLGLKVQADF